MKYARLQAPHFFPCDTMEVKKGDTSYIFSGAQLAWNANTTKKRMIHVKGTLIIEGWDEEPVTIAGTLEQNPFGLIPGAGQWDGFLVDSGGELQLTRVRLYNAPSAIISYSENVRLRKVHVKGVQGLIGPYTDVRIEGREADIDSMDFKNTASQENVLTLTPNPIPDKKAATVTASKPKSHILRWSLVGSGVLLAGGGLIWFLSEGPTPDSNPGNPDPFSKKPEFPGDGPRN